MKTYKTVDEVKKRFEHRYQIGKTPWLREEVDPDIERFIQVAKEEFEDGKVLDLGCGNGWLAVVFAKQGFKVKGIDSSLTAIDEAKKMAKKEGVTIDFKVGDALDFSYQKDKFDIVVDRGLLHHLPESEWPRYKTGVSKVLKSGGLFYLMVHSDKSRKEDFNPQTGRMWREIREEDGFTSFDHYFNKDVVDKLFGPEFETIATDEDKKPSSSGSLILYFTMRKR